MPESIDGFTYGVLGWLWIGSGGTLKLMGSGGLVWESARYGPTFGARVVRLPATPVVVTAGSYSINAFIPVVGP